MCSSAYSLAESSVACLDVCFLCETSPALLKLVDSPLLKAGSGTTKMKLRSPDVVRPSEYGVIGFNGAKAESGRNEEALHYKQAG